MQVIEANLKGELNLKIETELVCVTTHFKDLENPLLREFSYGLCFASNRIVSVYIEFSMNTLKFGFLCFPFEKGLRSDPPVPVTWWCS